MNIEARKLSFIQDYLRIDNEKILSAVENFFYKTKSEQFEENLKPMSMQEFNEEIDKALEDETNGRLTKAEDLKERINQWK